ncbi:MAG: PKD domain-containing protein [Paludibacteraceae bacterium]|nr:PKD domain-containing protein [Paludibacteraceae bacterium]
MNNENTPPGSGVLELKLIASSRQNATVTVRNPQTGWNQNFTVQANAIAELVLPHNQCYTYNAETVEQHGLTVTSTAPIALYAANFRAHTYDATIVLPTTALSTDYIIQTYENELYPKELAVVATADGTQVTITPHARTTQGRVKGVPFSVTLRQGETYQVMSDDSGNDFSGTRIESNRAVAVFAGHQCINIPTDNPWCDHIVEQQMPTQMWGREFIVTKTSGQNGDRVMITAKENGTAVRVNGTTLTTLTAGSSYEFRLTDNSAYIETSQPATCFLYLEGARDNNMIGDPSSVHISSIEQQIKQLTFATFETSVSRTHFINIVTTAAGAVDMTLDGQSIASLFQPVASNSNYRYAQVRIQHGTHTLQTSRDGFVGHVYGLGWCESYAYTFGSAAIPLDGMILVNGEPRADVKYDEHRCYKEGITFSPRTNTAFNSIWWDLGDGTTSTQPTVTHTYSSAGDYRIRMIVQDDDSRDTAYTNLHLDETLHDTIYAGICSGETYIIGQQTLSTSGTHNIRFTSAGGCDSIVTLVLNVGQNYLKIEEDSIRQGMSYRWHWRWYSEAGVYRDTLTSTTGCDSIVELHLKTIDPTEVMYDTICYRPSYTFRGHVYPLPSIAGFEDRDYVDYTLEYRDVENCITYKMHLAISPLGNGEIVLYDTIQQGQVYDFFGDRLAAPDIYYKTVSSGAGCAQDYVLHLAVLSYPINVTEATLCGNDSYTYRGKTYTEPGVYNDTVFAVTGIEAIYQLQLTDMRSHTELNIQTVGSYTFNGQTYTESGTYTATLTNTAGCDSIVTLHLGIGEPCRVTEDVNMSLCDGEQITWNGMTCTAGGTYTASFTTSGGCDSIATLHLTPLQKSSTYIDVKICQGDYYRVGEERLYTAGTHTVVLHSANGCDSTVSVNLQYKPTYSQTFQITIEEGQSYTWDGTTYSAAGNYVKGYVSQLGCDSVVTLQLNVIPHCATTRTESLQICSGETVNFYGTLLTTSGVYTHIIPDVICDTIVTLTLTVFPPVEDTHTNITINEGESYTWHGTSYNATGDYTFTMTDNNGCAYTDYLHLTVTPHCVTARTESLQRCSGETVNFYDTLLTTSGVYTHIVPDVVCDTIVTLTLTVFPPVEDTHTNITIDEGDTYTWHGTTYAVSGMYSYQTTDHNGCAYTDYLHLTVTPYAEIPVQVYEVSIGEECAGRGMLDISIRYKGLPTSIELQFSAEALANGFSNGTYDLVDGHVVIPYNARAGNYSVTVTVMQAGIVRYKELHAFTLLYPADVLEQGWMDAVLVLTHDYNGGYDFTGFQWYKNGQMLSGETGPYLYQPLTVGAAYQAMLTDVTGLTLMTCPLYAALQDDVSVYPTIAGRRQQLRCISSQPAKVVIYDHMGQRVGEYDVCQGESELAAPAASGLYMAKVMMRSGSEKTIKIVVQ